MIFHAQETAFTPDWPEPAARFLRTALPPAPALPLRDVFTDRWTAWIAASAEAKSAPPDYVVAGLFAAAGTAIGNSRWAEPWHGWVEPPVLWTMAIGSPSSNKSPGMDAVLSPLKDLERSQRTALEPEVTAWRKAAELAKLAESAWKEQAKAALKDGTEPPERPESAKLGPEPFPPRLAIADGTVERLAVIAAKQPRGTLVARDELAGWLQGMTRYAGGGSDRPFWLEAYGGRPYTVERMGREPVHVDRLTVGVTGSIQPDRLKSLLMGSDDDGLLARFIPIWPDPVTLHRPRSLPDAAFFERALARLYTLHMYAEADQPPRPLRIPFSNEAADQLDTFRSQARAWEIGTDGLLLSFIGKLPGLAVRLSLVLTYLDWAETTGGEPLDISGETFARVTNLISTYTLPMARRAYADASLSKSDRSARRIIAAIQTHKWHSFTSRDVMRLDISGLTTAAQLNPALALLKDGDIIRALDVAPNPNGGRPTRRYAVNPAIHGKATA